MLYKTCVETQQSAVIVEFGMGKNRAGNNMVFEKLPFQNVSRPQENKKVDVHVFKFLWFVECFRKIHDQFPAAAGRLYYCERWAQPQKSRSVCGACQGWVVFFVFGWTIVQISLRFFELAHEQNSSRRCSILDSCRLFLLYHVLANPENFIAH